MRYFLCLMLFWGVAVKVAAQNITLKGNIVDAETHEGVPFATVYLKNTSFGVYADSLGMFELSYRPTEHDTLLIEHVSFFPYQQAIHFHENNTIHIDIKPNRLVFACPIVATRLPNTFTQTQNTLSGIALAETYGQNLGTALSKIAGVTTLQTGSTIVKPVIHGLHSNRILILNNGIRQEGQQWGSEHAPEIDAFIAKQYTVVKGASAVRYGSDAIAGVILVEPNTIRFHQGTEGDLHLVGFSNGRTGVISGRVGHRFGKKMSPLGFQVQGTFKQGGNLQTPTYYLKNTGIEELNGSLMAEWRKDNYYIETFYSHFQTKIGIFSGSHIGNLTDLMNAFEAEKPADSANFSYQIARPSQVARHDLWKTKLFVRAGKAGRLYITAASQFNVRYEYDKHRPLNDSLSLLNRPEFRMHIFSHSLETLWEHARFHHFAGQIGLFGMYQNNDVYGRFLIPDYQTWTGGIFAIERWQYGKWEVEGGIRYDVRHTAVKKWKGKIAADTSFFYQNISTNLGAIFHTNEDLTFNVNAGKAWRAPGVNELYSNGLHHGAASIEIGDKHLQAEKAYNFILTGNYHHENLGAEVSLYRNYIQDFIYTEAGEPRLTVQGAFPTFYYKQANAVLSGIDFYAHYTFLRHFTLQSKAAIVRAWNREMQEWIPYMPADRWENGIKVSSDKIGRFELPYITISALKVWTQTRIPSTADLVAPPKGYVLWNIESGGHFHIKKQEVRVGLGVTNLLNTIYRDYMNRFRYFANEPGRNVSLRISFAF